MPEYTADWFSHNIPVWEELLAPFKDKPCRFLEIGCFEGRASVWLLENILTHPLSSHTVIDTFVGSEEHEDYINVNGKTILQRFENNIRPYKQKVKVFVGESFKNLAHMQGTHSFDFIYIDADHHVISAYLDAAMSWPLLKQNGIMIWDDFAWISHKHPNDPLFTPALAVQTFLEFYKGQYQIVHSMQQCAIKKLVDGVRYDNENVQRVQCGEVGGQSVHG